MKQVLLILYLLLPILAKGQVDTSQWTPPLPAHYSFVNYEQNIINNPNKLDAFFSKLQVLKQSHSGRVTIVHIGDSHLQADGITSVLRRGFQDFFGDAGRGLVFPYQLAGSNAPHDIGSSSNTSWKSNRLTNTANPLKTGISGYGIHSAKKDAVVNISVKETDGIQETFNKMIFFLCDDSVCYRLTDSNLSAPLSFSTRSGIDKDVTVNSSTMLSGFGLTATNMPESNDLSFYGVSLEKKDSAGILYHTIGVNGARMDQFLQNDLFWRQLKVLNGDLFIVSLGTNEAQNPSINEAALMIVCDSFVRQIHKIAPKALVLFTTPAGSYYKMKRPNASLQPVSDAIVKYSRSKAISYWNLFLISSGKAGAAAWKKHDLLSHDLVHYNNAGYQLQGQLLLNSFAKAYNSYTGSHPYKPAQVIEKKRIQAPKEVIKNGIPDAPGKNIPAQPEEKPTVPIPVTRPDPKKKSNILVNYYED